MDCWGTLCLPCPLEWSLIVRDFSADTRATGGGSCGRTAVRHVHIHWRRKVCPFNYASNAGRRRWLRLGCLPWHSPLMLIPPLFQSYKLHFKGDLPPVRSASHQHNGAEILPVAVHSSRAGGKRSGGRRSGVRRSQEAQARRRDYLGWRSQGCQLKGRAKVALEDSEEGWGIEARPGTSLTL